MRERAKTIAATIIITLAVFAGAYIALADPLGAKTLKVEDSQRGVMPTAGISVPAEAGNVSEIMINATSITKTWQGYFGNITGKIVLDNALNKSMYDWTDLSPQGEIFVANETSITWAQVFCFNMDPGVENEGNLTAYESYIGLASTDYDGINETFNSKAHSAFNIGTRSIGANSCWSLKTYKNDAAQTSSSDFIEVMMYDNTSNRAVFATIINNTVQGFDSKSWDFQMMVPVKGGHETPAVTDNFYFWVELD